MRRIRLASLLMTAAMLFPSFSYASGDGIAMLPSEEVRVISVNVCVDQQDIDERGPKLMDLLLSYSPDSIGTQENGCESISRWPAIFETGLPNYSRVGLSGDGYLEHSHNIQANYIYYNNEKFECLDWQTLWMSPVTRMICSSLLGDYPSTVTWCLLRNRDTGFVYAHVNCHLSYEDMNEAEYQMAIVANLAEQFASAGIPVFSTGDYNMSEGSAGYYIMMNKPHMTDPKYLADKSADEGTWRGWSPRDRKGQKPIDFCFISGELMHVSEYSVIDTTAPDGQILTDHCAVFVRATVNSLPDTFSEGCGIVSMEGAEFSELRKSAYVYDFQFTRPVSWEHIYYYLAELRDKDGRLIDTRKIYTLNADETVPETRTCTFTALEPETDYSVRLYPCTIAGTRGLPEVITFRSGAEK